METTIYQSNIREKYISPKFHVPANEQYSLLLLLLLLLLLCSILIFVLWGHGYELENDPSSVGNYSINIHLEDQSATKFTFRFIE